MQVADFFLSDGGKRVDRVKPDVEGRVLGQLGEASILEIVGVLDGAQGTHKVRPLGQH